MNNIDIIEKDVEKMVDEEPKREITVELVRKTVPKSLRFTVTPALVEKINNACDDPILVESIKENFLTYSSVLTMGKYSVEEYLNGIIFASHRMKGTSVVQSYIKTFPQRYERLMKKGVSKDELNSYAKMYNKTKLVVNIMEQAMIPVWLLNQDAYQKAINTQVELMTGAKSERVRAMAADSILNHLKRPESAAPTVNIDMRETQNIADLKKAILDLAQTQKNAIAQGVSPRAIVETEIVDGEYRAKEENVR